MTDYSGFDTSNLRVTKLLIHPIKVFAQIVSTFACLTLPVELQGHIRSRSKVHVAGPRGASRQQLVTVMVVHSLIMHQNDRKWCVIRADNHVVVTARQVGKVRFAYRE